MKRLWLLLVLPAALALAGIFVYQQTDALTGTVTDTSSAPLAGILVSAHGPNGVTTTATTDEMGRYVLPGLGDAAYTLRAHGIGFEPSDLQPHDAPAGQQVDFALRRRANVYDQAPSASFLGLLPEGVAKRQFILDCTGCHQFDRTIIEADGHLKNRDQWHQRITQMLSFAGAESNFPIMAPSRDADETADWLVMHVGNADDPLPSFDAPPATGKAADVLITEYPLPDTQDLPHDIALMDDGRVLVTGMMTHQMYTLDPATGAFETHPIPVQYANPRALTIDDAGGWWVLLGFPQKIASYDPSMEAWTDYDIGMYPHSIVRAADGRIWFNGHFTKEPEQIGALDPATGDVMTYDVPVSPMPDGGSTIPYGLRLGPDGTLWGTQLVGGRLVKFDPATEQFALYELPTMHSGPRRPDIAPDGTVWIPEYAANKLARFDPATESFTEYDLPIANALPYVVRVDNQRNRVWIATAAADAVLRFDPATEMFVTYRLPTHRALIRHMALDAETGAVWVAYGNSPAVAPKIARLVVRDPANRE